MKLGSLLLTIAANAAALPTWTCDDASGVLGQTLAPVALTLQLSGPETTAARAGRHVPLKKRMKDETGIWV